MKVQFGKLTTLNGKIVRDEKDEGVFLSALLANAIVTGEAKENTLQKFELAFKLNPAKDDVIEITDSEKEIIKKVCEEGRLNILVAGQILKVVNNPIKEK